MNWNIDPVLLELGPLELRYYGIFFALGLFLSYLLAAKMFKIKKWKIETLDLLSIYLIIGTIVGARLGHIVFYELDYYWANPIQVLKIWEGGLASHGGAIGILLAYLFFLRKHEKKGDFKTRFFKYADLMVVPAAFPVALIRLGNFFNSEIVGRPTDGPFGVIFERVDDIARHPSQLYEFFMGLILLFVLWPLWKRKHKTAPKGFFFGLFFMLYFAMRFTVEFVKEYPLHTFDLTTGQYLSLPFFIFGAIIFGISLKKTKS